MSDLHLDLDLDFHGESIDGRLREDNGSVHRFHGWLGLVDALERLRPKGGANSITETAPAATKTFVLIHRHSPAECGAAHAAWTGFDSPLRGVPVQSTCAHHQSLESTRRADAAVMHEIWWTVHAAGPVAALAQLPPYVAERTNAREVTEMTVG